MILAEAAFSDGHSTIGTGERAAKLNRGPIPSKCTVRDRYIAPHVGEPSTCVPANGGLFQAYTPTVIVESDGAREDTVSESSAQGHSFK